MLSEIRDQALIFVREIKFGNMFIQFSCQEFFEVDNY